MLFKEHNNFLELAEDVNFSAFQLFTKPCILSLMYESNSWNKKKPKFLVLERLDRTENFDLLC